VLVVLVAFLVAVGAAEAWQRTRPAPLEEPAPSLGECVAVGRNDVATYASLTLTNRSDDTLELLTLRLVEPSGVIQTGTALLVPISQEVIGSQGGFPPTARLDAPGVRWQEQRALSRGTLEPAAEVGTMNVVVGIRLLPGTVQPSFQGLELSYKAGRRTHTWHSQTPVRFSQSC
jgi:hypothetical protein